MALKPLEQISTYARAHVWFCTSSSYTATFVFNTSAFSNSLWIFGVAHRVWFSSFRLPYYISCVQNDS